MFCFGVGCCFWLFVLLYKRDYVKKKLKNKRHYVCACGYTDLKHSLLASLCHHPHCSFMIDRVHLFPCSKLNYFAINSLLKIARLLNSECLIVRKAVYG